MLLLTPSPNGRPPPGQTGENVKGLRTPKVNPSIWSQLSTSMKTQDVRSQKGQNTLIGAISAMTKTADLALGKKQQRQRTDHLADRCGCHGPPIQPRGESLPTPGHEERDA